MPTRVPLFRCTIRQEEQEGLRPGSRQTANAASKSVTKTDFSYFGISEDVLAALAGPLLKREARSVVRYLNLEDGDHGLRPKVAYAAGRGVTLEALFSIFRVPGGLLP